MSQLTNQAVKLQVANSKALKICDPQKFPHMEESRIRVSRFSRAHPVPAPIKPIAPRLINEPAKKPKNDESFDAEDNENELSAIAIKQPINNKLKQEKIDKTEKQQVRIKQPNIVKMQKYTGAVSTAKAKKIVPEHFEQEMDKHGLLDKIVHIQQLNKIFENELGAISKRPDIPQIQNVEVSGLEKGQNSPTSDKAYAFPFQKRARSNSPPKNGALLFISKNSENSGELSPSDPSRKPVVARANFVMGKAVKQLKFSPKAHIVDQFLKSLESEDDMCCGLSTGPTDELKGSGIVQPEESEDPDSWMYQRINQPGGLDDISDRGDENVAVGEEEEGTSFLQMLNQAKFDK